MNIDQAAYVAWFLSFGGNMKFDLTKPYCYYFNELTKIPHGSYNEHEISDYVVSFAKEQGLKCVQDDMWNVVIYKDATSGYEEYDPIMLQGHLDMVCEAVSGLDFDFEKQPLETYVDEQGRLRAKGTTLGADDGMGVAEMLAILSDDSLKHPPLECVFTVQEEVGMFGALALDKSLIHSHRMISLDGGGEVLTAISSAGGVNVINTIPCTFIPNDKPTYSLKVTGLTGGHSGGEIHKEKGNANKLVSRILKEMMKDLDVCLVSINGGTKDNAITRESLALFSSSTSNTVIEKKVNELTKKIYVEFEDSDSGFKTVLESVETSPTCMSDESTKNVIDYMYLVPNGFQHRSVVIEGLTLTSLNLGIVKTEEGKVICNSSVRSALEEAIDDYIDHLRCLASYTGGSVKTFARYPGWKYDENSKLRKTYREVLSELEDGTVLQERAGHGGLECAVFTQIDGGMDIITCGPISEGCHTPDEYLDLASFDRTYLLLTKIIESVDKKV